MRVGGWGDNQRPRDSNSWNQQSYLGLHCVTVQPPELLRTVMAFEWLSKSDHNSGRDEMWIAIIFPAVQKFSWLK